MKHWCFYTRVVTYLEKVEALFPDKKRKDAYLLWRDDDGNPLMIAGPGVDWFQGCSPMPDLNNLGQAVASLAAQRHESHSCRRSPPAATRQLYRRGRKSTLASALVPTLPAGSHAQNGQTQASNRAAGASPRFTLHPPL